MSIFLMHVLCIRQAEKNSPKDLISQIPEDQFYAFIKYVAPL